MSYILDALKRAEHERNGALGNAPGAAPAPTGIAGLSPSLLALIGVLLFAAGIGISWLLLRPAAPPAVAAPVVATAAPATPAPPTATAAPTATAVAIETTIAPAEATASDVEAELVDAASEPAPALEGYESLDDLTPVFQGANPPATTSSQRADPALTAQRRTTGGFVPPATTPAPVHMEPSLRDMPQAYRDQFPAISIQVHVYDAAPEKRWIMVDGKRLGEGSSLASGPQIVRIAPDGIVFAHRNERVFWPLQR